MLESPPALPRLRAPLQVVFVRNTTWSGARNPPLGTGRPHWAAYWAERKERADTFRNSGPRSWSSSENWLKPVPLHDHIAKYGEPAKMICPYTGVDRLA